MKNHLSNIRKKEKLDSFLPLPLYLIKESPKLINEVCYQNEPKYQICNKLDICIKSYCFTYIQNLQACQLSDFDTLFPAYVSKLNMICKNFKGQIT